jgi:hypothetical protein
MGLAPWVKGWRGHFAMMRHALQQLPAYIGSLHFSPTSINMKQAWSLVLMLCLSLLLMAAGSVRAQGVPIDDEALSEVWGQAMFSLTNTTVGDYDFSRLTINADVTLAATLTGLRFGEYTTSGGTTTGAIDIGSLTFGNVSTKSTVKITDPYLEFVYKNSSDASTREVVGMRLGFGGITGNLAIQINALTGNLYVTTASSTVTSTSVDLTSLTSLTAGNSAGASRDCYLSILKAAVTYPAAATGLNTTTAQAGFWLNWTDRLSGILN